MDSILYTCAEIKPCFWRPWEDNDQVTTTCVDQGFASPPKKRTRVYYTDEQRQDKKKIHDPKVKAVIKQQLARDFQAKKKRIREYIKRCSRDRRLQNTKNRTRPSRHATQDVLTRSVPASPHPTQSAVTLTTRTSKTCMTSNSPTYQLYQPLEESLSLDSVIMVPFLRIHRGDKAGCVNDDDYCYVSAAKFLGFYRIADERRD